MDQPAAKSKRLVKTVLGLLCGCALLAFLLFAVDDPRAAIASLRNLSPLPLVLGLVAYVLCYVCRAIRFRMLLPGVDVPLGKTTAIVAVHNLLNMLLPARTGELSYVYLAQNKLGAKLSQGAASLVVARLYDLVGIAAFFLTAFVLTRHDDGHETQIAIGAVLLLGGSLLALAALGPIVGATVSFLRRFDWFREGFPARLLLKLESLGSELAASKRRGQFLPLFLVTQAQWLFTFLTCFGILRACEGAHDFPFIASIVGSTGLSLALILPINPVGNVGTFQAGWILGYTLVGLDKQTATASAIAAHLAILLYASLLAAWGYLALRESSPRSA